MNVDTGVYSITNAVNGKIYIGSARSFAKRWSSHRSDLRNNVHRNARLQNAWNKYGEDSFIFRKIALCTITDLIAIEQRFIDKLKPEYNICQTAGSQFGLFPSQETRGKISAALRASPKMVEYWRRMRGVSIPTERLEKMWDATRGVAKSEEHKRKISESNRGLPKSAETREKIAASKRGIPLSAEHIAKISASLSGERNYLAKSVRCIETGAIFVTVTDATKWLIENGYPKASTSKLSFACNGKRLSAYGYRWEYANNTGN